MPPQPTNFAGPATKNNGTGDCGSRILNYRLWQEKQRREPELLITSFARSCELESWQLVQPTWPFSSFTAGSSRLGCFNRPLLLREAGR